jgi:hypothetical protein
MFLYSIYLLFKNNIESFYSINYSIYFIKSLLFISCVYTLPLLILDQVIQISDNTFANIISKYIFTNMYYLPTYIILLIIHNSRLIKLLERQHIVYNNPSHIYVTLFYVFIYILLGLMGTVLNFKRYIYYIIFILDSISYGLFFNETAYIFLDNSIYKYTNKVDFYNNHYILFNIYGIFLNYILQNVSYIYFMPVSFIMTSILQNALIAGQYKKYYKNEVRYNILYPFEKIFNMFITLISTVIFFSLHKRRMYNIRSV